MNILFYPVKLYGEWWSWPQRRKAIQKALLPFIPSGHRVLDVGCGDGKLAHGLVQLRPDLKILGTDTNFPDNTPVALACCRYDGQRLPFADNTFDTCLLIDVLHHSRHPEKLLEESARVARCSVVLKDHDYRNRLDFKLMQAGDYLGNRMFGVDLPYQFKRWDEFEQMFDASGLKVAKYGDRLKPAGLLELHHHFIVRLVPKAA